MALYKFIFRILYFCDLKKIINFSCNTKKKTKIESIKTANPGPLGLAGFGMATILLNIHNMGFFPVDITIVAMGLFIGGIIQVMVGSWEWKHNNMFGMMAFTGYGFFWLTLSFIFILPKTGLVEPASAFSMGCYLTIWGTFTVGLLIATLKMNRMTQLLFSMVALLFALLAISDFTQIASIKVVAGFEGVLCGALALYLSMAQVINNQFERQVLRIL